MYIQSECTVQMYTDYAFAWIQWLINQYLLCLMCIRTNYYVLHLAQNAQLCFAVSAHTIKILWYTHIPTKKKKSQKLINTQLLKAWEIIFKGTFFKTLLSTNTLDLICTLMSPNQLRFVKFSYKKKKQLKPCDMLIGKIIKTTTWFIQTERLN